MAILAHPDDESLGTGGTLARYAAEGVEVSVVTATRGEAGRYGEHRSGPEHPGPDQVGVIREAELRAACAALGVRSLSLLGYHDGQLDQAPPREAIARIAGEVRRLAPDVAITFPPDGAYGHPDHIAISQLAQAALVAAADAEFEAAPLPGAEREFRPHPPHAVRKLYYMAATAEMWAVYEFLTKKLVSVVDGVERQAVPWPEWAVTTTIDTREHWQIAWRAVSCHASQMSVYARLRDLAPEHHEGLWGKQDYYRVYSLVNGGRAHESDLFEGLR